MSNGTNSRRTKVARVIDKYELTEMGDQLEAEWTGQHGERTSLRDLADEFNEAVLAAALRRTGESPMEYEISGTYQTLTSDSSTDATRARRRLEREGIDVDAVTSDFVTHQAIHTFLKQDREASLPADNTDLPERKIESIEKLQGRLAAVTESAIGSLASSNDLDRDDYDVLVDVRTVCPDCGSDLPVGELLRDGGCECTM
ncbi:rod-determining factor RdfA [Halobaculum magnesiiphilum]|uniref:Uncharacterized protein n=1 Tax=Halobaculum magnesiiphilum TaxID=1017351 RepID=A0A8T8WIY5_9EURY|nr:rod-determining factor RdfA [Halobaculum magnesiiphilum]QZP39756.1 hypothetical protein K6T50_17430 [Halobaculum magnesiiphilum]